MFKFNATALTLALIILFGTSNSFSEENNEKELSMSLLNNRFRVDPTVERITFIIRRIKQSQPAILVRPDGKKYYAWRNPENVHWYQNSLMDIISIEKPMPGPWQAIGKIDSQNKIQLVSNLTLQADTLPKRLFNGEIIKFKAQLLNQGNPLLIKDFLDNVKLKVTFHKLTSEDNALEQNILPIAEITDEFADNGKKFDEYPGDGIFTVPLIIRSQPGKYRVEITSSNDIFLRSEEQIVSIYPNPIKTNFIQGINKNSHQIVFSGKKETIAPGSLTASVEYFDNKNTSTIIQNTTKEREMTLILNLANKGTVGTLNLYSSIYANDMDSNRPLHFIIEKNYRILKQMDYKLIQEVEESKLKIQQNKKKNIRNIIVIMISNITIVGLAVWFARRLKRH
ncbi:TIGR03503 family protein [Candidatus Photodesmus blepharus]|nr:TIGR03503 family protein [Candidatus Photodesmus blepharus]